MANCDDCLTTLKKEGEITLKSGRKRVWRDSDSRPSKRVKAQKADLVEATVEDDQGNAVTAAFDAAQISVLQAALEGGKFSSKKEDASLQERFDGLAARANLR